MSALTKAEFEFTAALEHMQRALVYMDEAPTSTQQNLLDLRRFFEKTRYEVFAPVLVRMARIPGGWKEELDRYQTEAENCIDTLWNDVYLDNINGQLDDAEDEECEYQSARRRVS